MGDRIINSLKVLLHRAQFHLRRAKEATAENDRFNDLIAACYPCRAVVEQMKEEFDRLGCASRLLEVTLLISYWEFVYRLRIHEFHRGAISNVPHGVTFQGPITLSTGSGGPGSALVTFGPRGLRKYTSGHGKIKEDRPIAMHGDRIICLYTGHEYPLMHVIDEYVASLPQALARFENILAEES